MGLRRWICRTCMVVCRGEYRSVFLRPSDYTSRYGCLPLAEMVERETELQQRQRELFAKYLSLTHEHFLSQPYKGQEYTDEQLAGFFGITTAEIEIYTTRDQVALIASDRIWNAVSLHDKKFRAWKVAFPPAGDTSPESSEKAKAAARELQQSHAQLLRIMRTELAEHHQFRFPRWMQNLLSKEASKKLARSKGR